MLVTNQKLETVLTTFTFGCFIDQISNSRSRIKWVRKRCQLVHLEFADVSCCSELLHLWMKKRNKWSFFLQENSAQWFCSSGPEFLDVVDVQLQRLAFRGLVERM